MIEAMRLTRTALLSAVLPSLAAERGPLQYVWGPQQPAGPIKTYEVLGRSWNTFGAGVVLVVAVVSLRWEEDEGGGYWDGDWAAYIGGSHEGWPLEIQVSHIAAWGAKLEPALAACFFDCALPYRD